MPNHEFYSVPEAAKLLGLSVATLNIYNSRGTGPKSHKVSTISPEKRNIVFRYEDLTDWEESRRAEARAKKIIRKAERKIVKQRKLSPKQADKIFRKKLSEIVVDAGPDFGMEGLRNVLAAQGFTALKRIPAEKREDFISAVLDAALAHGTAQ